MRPTGADIHVRDGFLSPGECAEYIALAEREGFSPATVSLPEGARWIPEIRNNQRVDIESESIAANLFVRAKPLLPICDGLEAIGLNPHIKVYRYASGERFNRHRDGVVKLTGRKSVLSFLIYLNSDFQGGKTSFAETSVTPATGRLLMFKHALKHKGERVEAGLKYVLRSDVMYPAPPAVG